MFQQCHTVSVSMNIFVHSSPLLDYSPTTLLPLRSFILRFLALEFSCNLELRMENQLHRFVTWRDLGTSHHQGCTSLQPLWTMLSSRGKIWITTKAYEKIPLWSDWPHYDFLKGVLHSWILVIHFSCSIQIHKNFIFYSFFFTPSPWFPFYPHFLYRLLRILHGMCNSWNC